MENVLAYALRIFLVYLFTYFGARMLSKKAIAEMTAYEMVGIILIGTVAAEPLISGSALKTVFCIGFLVLVIYLTSRLALVNKLNPVLEHVPTVIVNHGQVDSGVLKDSTLSINQLLGLLQEKGFDKLTDVEFAILAREPCPYFQNP